MFKFEAEPNDIFVEFSIIDPDLPENEKMVAKGYIKWDGCSNWDANPDGVMLHFCSNSELREFSQVLELCCQYAKDHFDNEFFD